MFEDTNSVILWLICDKSVTTQNLWFFWRSFCRFWSATRNVLWVQRRHNCSPAASFGNLRYDTIPVKSASANVSFYTSNSKNAKFW